MINVHNNWDPLEEIWLGDTWPASFYDNLEGEIKDSFYQITEWSKEDLNVIQKKFEELGVTVRRPTIDESKRELYTVTEKSTILKKPPICPRDTHGVIGNNLFIGGDLPECYEPIYTHYDQSQIHRPREDDTIPDVRGHCIVKLGKDIICDHWVQDQRLSEQERKLHVFREFHRFERQEGKWFGDQYRLHFSTEGGHVDSCYMPIKEGVVLTTDHTDGYESLMPGWKTIGIKSPSYMAEEDSFRTNNRFIPSNNMPLNKWEGNFAGMMDNAPSHFNAYINQYCADWIGNYKETYFEVNVVPIDDKNLICIDTSGAFDGLFNRLEQEGITCHVVPWRTRGFWDGGIHCITLDVRRRGELVDYFPDRIPTGYTVKNQFFQNTDSFFKEYNEWKTQL